MKNFAQLKVDSPFFPLFAPSGLVPIQNILVPNRAECIGDGVQDVYLVDLQKLTPMQFALLAEMVRKQCDPNTDFQTVVQEIHERGLPLRAKHVASVSSNAPFFL